LKRRLPSLNALRAFEAAARLGRIDAAAEELSVTPAAVSHQIKGLEEYFGMPLFHRTVRKIRPTDTGRALLPQLTEGFDLLAAACRTVDQPGRDGVLTVSAPPTFAARWLVQRLQGFYDLCPDISVRLDGSVGLTTFTGDDADIDVAVRFGAGPYPHLHAELIGDVSVFPVCSPALLEGKHPIRTPDDLRHHTLLHVEWRTSGAVIPDWPMWLALAGVEGVDPRRGPRFNSDELAIAAAVEGQGVALVTAVYAGPDVETGRLVRLFDVELPTEYHYWLVCPPAHMARPKVKAFRDWIMAESGAG